MKKGRFCLHAFLVCVCCCIAISNAYADNCNDLDQNPKWVQGFEQLNLEYKSGNWDQALKVSRQLEGICEFSPSLNYTIARIHKNKNDNEKYLFYLQKATQNTERFVVDKYLLDRLWSEKYIVAHPEASPESIEGYQREIENLKKAILDRSEDIKAYRSIMWAGTGICIGGLAFAATGLGMALSSEPASYHNGMGLAPDTYTENWMHSLGWAFVGAGTAMTVTGAVLAGIYGYKYKHHKDNADLSLKISPLYTSFQVAF